MFDINSYNLKWAFKKLKTHYFYYHSSNYLKNKIINFEKNLENGRTSFESIAKNINEFLSNPLNRFSNFYSYNYFVYPKKNSFVLKDGEPVIDNSKTNYFIDLDISIHLVDVLFSMEIIDNLHSMNIINKNSYGGIVDNRVFKSKSLLENNFLFEDYKKGYQRWINIPVSSVVSSLGCKKTVIRTDIKSCFYNIKFNFNRLMVELGLSNSKCAIVMKNVYNLYTSYIIDKTGDLGKDFRQVVLPIGLFSSQLIINYLLKSLDDMFLDNECVIAYGRYIDDIIVVLNSDKLVDNIKIRDFENIFPSIFENCEESIRIKKFGILAKGLTINSDKTIIKPISSTQGDESNDALYDHVSFCDYYDSERENSPSFFFEELSSEDIRSVIYETLNESNETAYQKFIKCDDATVLNCFTFWNDIFYKFRTQNDKILEISNKIQNAISKISLKNAGQLFAKNSNSIKGVLLGELRIASKLLASSESNCYFGNINQEDLLKIIYKTKNKEYEYAPMIFSLAEISFYISVENNFNYNKSFIDDVKAFYCEINNVSDISGFGINDYDFNCNQDTFIGLQKKNSIKQKLNEKVFNVALGALNMEGLKQSDAVFKSPGGYTIDDIFKILKTAHKNKAKYLLFPEFALEFSWILPVIKEARKRNITLVSGVIHYKLPSSLVVNLTIIFEKNTGLLLFKIKNYMSPEEKAIITYNKPDGMGLYYYEPPTKKYFLINDGIISYSIMTCYEATNIQDRAKLADKINVLFMPVYNYDTEYFSNIINSLSRDISCYVLQANSNALGDTKIRMPTNHHLADIVCAKGGINNYCIIEKINIYELENGNNDFFKELSQIDLGCKKPKEEKHDKPIKPLSAGNHHFK